MAGIPAICLEGWTPVPSGVHLGIDPTSAVPTRVLDAPGLAGIVQVHLGDGSLGATRIGDALSREHVATIARMVETLDPDLAAAITRAGADARTALHGLPVGLPGRLDLLDPADQRVLPVGDDGQVTDPRSATGVRLLPEKHLADTLTTANRTDVAPVDSPMPGQLRLDGANAWIGLPAALVNARHAGLTEVRPTGMTGQVSGLSGLLTHLETLRPGQRAVVDVTRTAGAPPETYHVVAGADGLSVLRFSGGTATAQPLPRAAEAMSVTMPGRLGLSAASLATMVAELPTIAPDDLGACVTGIRNIARDLYGSVRPGQTVDDLATRPSTLTRSGDPQTDPFAGVADGQWGTFDSLETVRKALSGAPRGSRGATVFALVGRPGAIGHAVAFRNTVDGVQALDFRAGEASTVRPAENVADDLADARMLLVDGNGTVTEVATAVESASTVRSMLDSGLPDPATGIRYGVDKGKEPYRKRPHDSSGSKSGAKRQAGPGSNLIQQVRALLARFEVDLGHLPQQGRATDPVNFRYPRSYANTDANPLSRVRQSLRHLSTAAYEAGQALRDLTTETLAANDRDFEMQSMIFNDRLVMAFNSDTTMSLLNRRAAEIPNNPIAVLIRERDQISRYRGQERIEAQARLTRAVEKIESSESTAAGTREANSVTDILRTEGRTVLVDASDRARIREVLTQDRFQNAIILLQHSAEANMHAEQKHMVAIDNAGVTAADIWGDFAIAGRMRPCLACLLGLEHLGVTHGAHYNHNDGAAYDVAFETLVRHRPQVANNPDGSRTDGYWLLNRLEEILGGGHRTNYSAWSNEQAPANAVVGGPPQYGLQSAGPRPHDRRNYETPSESGSDRSFVPFEPTRQGDIRTVRQDLRNDPDVLRLQELTAAYVANRRSNQQLPREWTEIVGRLHARLGNSRAISEYTPGINENTVSKHVRHAERLLQNTGSELTPAISDALWDELLDALPQTWRDDPHSRGNKTITAEMNRVLAQMKAWGFSALSISGNSNMALPPTSFRRHFQNKIAVVEPEVPGTLRTDAPARADSGSGAETAPAQNWVEIDGVTWYVHDGRYYTYRMHGSHSRSEWATDWEVARIVQFLSGEAPGLDGGSAQGSFSDDELADDTANLALNTDTVPAGATAEQQFESQLTSYYEVGGYEWYADAEGYYRYSTDRFGRQIQIRASYLEVPRINDVRYPPQSSSAAAMAAPDTTMDFGTATSFVPVTDPEPTTYSETMTYPEPTTSAPTATGPSYYLPLRQAVPEYRSAPLQTVPEYQSAPQQSAPEYQPAPQQPAPQAPQYTRGVDYYVGADWVVHTAHNNEWEQTYTRPGRSGQYRPIAGRSNRYAARQNKRSVWNIFERKNAKASFNPIGTAKHLATPATTTLEPLTGELSTTPLTHGEGFVVGTPGAGLTGELTALRLPEGVFNVVGVGYRNDTGDGVRGGIRNGSTDYATGAAISSKIPADTAEANIIACEVVSTGTLRDLFRRRAEMTVIGADSEVFVVQGVDGSTEPAKVFTAETVWVDGKPQLIQTPANQFRAYRPGMSADDEPEALGHYLPGTGVPTKEEMARAVKASGAFHALGQGVALHLGPPSPVDSPPSPVDQIVRTLTDTVLDDDPKPGLKRARPLYDDNSVFNRDLRALLERQIDHGRSLASSLEHLAKQGYVRSALGDRLHVKMHRIELGRAIDHLDGALAQIPGPRAGVAATPVLEQRAFEDRNQVIAEAIEDYAIAAEEIAKHMRELVTDAAVKAAVRGDESKTKKILEKTIGLFEGALGWTAGVFLPTGLSFAPALVGLAGKGAGMAAMKAFEEYQATVFQRNNSSTKALLLADLNPQLMAKSIAASYQKGFELFLAAAGVGGAYVPGWPVISSGLTKIFTGFFAERIKLLEKSITELNATQQGKPIQEKELYRRLGDRLWTDLRSELKTKLSDLGTVQQIVNAAKGEPELLGLVGIGTDFAVQLGLGLVVTLFPPKPAAKIDGNELRRVIMDVISNRNPADTIVPPTVPSLAPDEAVPASVPQTDSHGRQILGYKASKSTPGAPYVKIKVNGTNLWGTLAGTRFTPKEPDTGAFVSMATWKDRVIGPDHYTETVRDPDTGAVTEKVRVDGTWHQPWPDFHFLFIHTDGTWEWARAFSPTGRMDTDEFNLKTEFDRHEKWVNKDFSFEAPPALAVNYKPRATQSTQHSWETNQLIDNFALRAANLSRIHGPRVPLRMRIEGGGNGPNTFSAGIQKLMGVPEQATASGLARAEEVRKDYVARLDQALDRLRYQHPGQGNRLPKAEDLITASSRGSELAASKLPAGLLKQNPALDDDALHRQTRVWIDDLPASAAGTPTSAHSSLGSSFHESDLDARPNWLADAMQQMPHPQNAPGNLIGEGVATAEVIKLAEDNPGQVFYWLNAPARQEPTREQLDELNERLEQFGQGRTQVSIFTKGNVTTELLDVIAPYGGALAHSKPHGISEPWFILPADRTTPRSKLPAQPSSRIDGAMATTMATLHRNPGIARADEQFGELVWSGLSVREQYDRIKSDPAAYLTKANQDLAAGMAQRVRNSLRAGIVDSLLAFGPETDVVPLVVESPMADRPKTVVSSVYELADAGVQHTDAITGKFQSLVDTIGRSTTDAGERDQLSFTSALLKAIDEARNGQLADIRKWAETHRRLLSPAMKTKFVGALGDVAKDLRTIGRTGDAQDLELVLAAVYEC
jgi:hypothetical protein